METKQLERIRSTNPFMPLSDIIFELLLQEIISFRLAPGTRLSESGIAQELGIDTPVCKVLSQVVRCIQGNYDKQFFKK